MTEHIDKLVAHIRQTLSDLRSPLSDPAYEYAAVPLCVMDAVFSIGVRYESTERTVRDWCARNGWEISRKHATAERTVTDFLKILEPYENRWLEMATEVFHNRQRTSSKSGILKAEAVFKFCKVLQRLGIETFADALGSGLRQDLRLAIKGISGQGSGVSYDYFLILVGHEDAVKPDRMVMRFVANALGVRDLPLEVSAELVREASKSLRPEFPELTPRLLDNKIWKFQRDQYEKSPGTCLATAIP
jgi:hypothetical protein